MIPQWLSLFVISVAAGIGLLWVFQKTSDQAAIRRTKKKLQAHLLEIRLYADDPAVIWQAQKNLLAANARYFALMLRPAVVVTLPMVVLLVLLDGYYGKQPLPVGRPAILTAQLRTDAAVAGPLRLEAPPQIEVETPAVRAMGERQVSWRIRPIGAVAGELRLVADGVTVTKSVAAGDGPRFVSSRRVRSLPALLIHPGETPLPAAGVEWVEVESPSAGVRMFGFETHWLVWFIVISMAAAFLLKGKFRVTV
jgi:uncharacterized membrane protein (DUF106 family)